MLRKASFAMLLEILFLKNLYLFSQPADNFLCSKLGEVCQLVTKEHTLPAGKLKVHLNQHDNLMQCSCKR